LSRLFKNEFINEHLHFAVEVTSSWHPIRFVTVSSAFLLPVDADDGGAAKERKGPEVPDTPDEYENLSLISRKQIMRSIDSIIESTRSHINYELLLG
jgi:hypothetical protein